MVEGLSRSSRAILWAAVLGFVALGWVAIFGLQMALEWAAPPAARWVGETFGALGSYGLLVGMIVASCTLGWWAERRRQREEYARDKTIHVERPNWWRQPLGRTRIPRVVWYYVGIVVVVMVGGVIFSGP